MATKRHIVIPAPATRGADELIELLLALGFTRGDSYPSHANRRQVRFYGSTPGSSVQVDMDGDGNVYDCSASRFHRRLYDNAKEAAPQSKTKLPKDMNIYELRAWLVKSAAELDINVQRLDNADVADCDWRDLHGAAMRLLEKVKRLTSFAGPRGKL